VQIFTRKNWRIAVGFSLNRVLLLRGEGKVVPVHAVKTYGKVVA
jgi:hypothetical protein